MHILISGMILLSASIYFYYYRTSDLPKILYPLLIFILSFVVVFIILIYTFCRRDDELPNYEETVMKKLTKKFESWNKKPFFIRKGMTWKTVPGHWWAEIHIKPGHDEFDNDTKMETV